MIKTALTIAGSDPSGGAGVQADLKTFHQAGVYGMSVITLLTVQNTQDVQRVEVLSGDLIRAQLEAVLTDITPGAAKTGALGNAQAIRAVSKAARNFTFPLVVDPVMVSKHGASLMDKESRAVLIRELLPCCSLVTPNIPEAEVLSALRYKDKSSLKPMAEKIASLGPKAVLIKGGHLEGDSADYLFVEGMEFFFNAPRIPSKHTHGTGCTFSAAITAGLSKGLKLNSAIACAKDYITGAIQTAPGLGHGIGPVNHFYRFAWTQE